MLTSLLLVLTPAFQDADAFPNAHLLVTTEWLAENGEADGRVVVDVRSASDYAAGHVPGAVNVATSETFDPAKRPGDLRDAASLAELLGARGISADDHVVLYDEGRSTSAARVFWTLEVYGHAKVSVVDGGFAKWRAEDRDVSTHATERPATKYVPKEPNGKLSTKDQVLEDVDAEDGVALDARSDGEYAGGHVPGAVHVEWVRNYTSDEVPVFKSPAELRALYVDQGVTPDKRVHGY